MTPEEKCLNVQSRCEPCSRCGKQPDVKLIVPENRYKIECDQCLIGTEYMDLTEALDEWNVYQTEGRENQPKKSMACSNCESPGFTALTNQGNCTICGKLAIDLSKWITDEQTVEERTADYGDFELNMLVLTTVIECMVSQVLQKDCRGTFPKNFGAMVMGSANKMLRECFKHKEDTMKDMDIFTRQAREMM